MAEAGERHELADQVAVLLQRAYPGELTKDELIDQSGLAQKELRAVLDSLSAEGELDPFAENFRWRDPSGEDRPPPAEDEAAEEHAEPALRTELVEASGQTNRLVLTVVGSFGHAGDDRDTEARAQALLEEVQNLLGTALPDFGAVVAIRRLEVFDRPRVLFDATGRVDAEEEAQESP